MNNENYEDYEVTKIRESVERKDDSLNALFYVAAITGIIVNITPIYFKIICIAAIIVKIYHKKSLNNSGSDYTKRLNSRVNKYVVKNTKSIFDKKTNEEIEEMFSEALEEVTNNSPGITKSEIDRRFENIKAILELDLEAEEKEYALSEEEKAYDEETDEILKIFQNSIK